MRCFCDPKYFDFVFIPDGHDFDFL